MLCKVQSLGGLKGVQLNPNAEPKNVFLDTLRTPDSSVAGGWAGICRSLGTGTLQTVCSTAAPRAQASAAGRRKIAGCSEICSMQSCSCTLSPASISANCKLCPSRFLVWGRVNTFINSVINLFRFGIPYLI